MRAAVLEQICRPLSLQERPVPKPGEGEILVRVEASGVCHSDVHVADGEQMQKVLKMPVIPGHEAVGRIERTGPGVQGLRIGDRVGVPWVHWTCGECESCGEGHENLCPRQTITGVTLDGGFAEYLVAKASHAARIPESLSPEEAAPLLCAGLTAYRALKLSGARPGDLVAIFGVGGLGHLAVQLAAAQGCRVAAVDVSEEKRALAQSLGAEKVFDGADPAVHRGLQALGGAKVALVTVGSKAAYEAAFRSLRRQGTLVVVGLPPEDLTFSPLLMVAKELRVVAASVGTRRDLEELLRLAAEGTVRCRVEARPLESINEVFDDLRRSRVLGRAVLIPNQQ